MHHTRIGIAEIEPPDTSAKNYSTELSTEFTNNNDGMVVDRNIFLVVLCTVSIICLLQINFFDIIFSIRFVMTKVENSVSPSDSDIIAHSMTYR